MDQGTAFYGMLTFLAIAFGVLIILGERGEKKSKKTTTTTHKIGR